MTNSIYAPRIVAAIPKPLAGTTETSNLYSNLSIKRLHSKAYSDRYFPIALGNYAIAY